MNAEYMEQESIIPYLQGFVTGAGLTLEGDETADELIEAMLYLTRTRYARR